jgi:hypothetical protein
VRRSTARRSSACHPLGPDFIAHLATLIEAQRPDLKPVDQGMDAEAPRFYRERAGHPVSAAQAQRALEALRQRTPALVWKSARGEDALEDAAMHRWFEKLVQAGRWPPAPPQGILPLDDD